MFDFDVVDGRKTAIMRAGAEVEELDSAALRDVEALWLTPEDGVPEFRRIVSLQYLKTLYVANCSQRLVRIFDQATLSSLESLVVAKSAGCLIGLERLPNSSFLKKLKVRDQVLSEEEVLWIQSKNSLLSLAATDVPINDEFLAGLSCRDNLRRLDVCNTQVEMKSHKLSAIQFKAVRSLDISATGVDSASIGTIEHLFPFLERLIAREIDVTTDDLQQISTWSHLRVLDTGNVGCDFDHHGDSFWDL